MGKQDHSAQPAADSLDYFPPGLPALEAGNEKPSQFLKEFGIEAEREIWRIGLHFISP